jgi:AI-2 transport protein TqsA
LTTIVTVAALRWLSPVVIPFVLAVVLTQCLVPLVDFQVLRLRMPNWLAVTVTTLLGVLLLGVFGFVISVSVGQMTANLDDYQERFRATMDWAFERAEKLSAAVPFLEQDELLVNAASPEATVGVAASEEAEAAHLQRTADVRRRIESLMTVSDAAVGSMLGGIARGAMNVVSNGALVLIFMIFMIMGRRPSTVPTGGILGEVQSRVRRYIITKVVVSAMTGVLVGATFMILRVDFALTFGFLAFLLNFIPNIGSVIATLLPVPVVLLSDDLSTTYKILAIAVPGCIQFAVGNVIEPKILGQSLDLHPVTVLISLIIFGMIWGIVGMFLAAPITAIIKILCEKIDITAPVADVLAGRLDRLAGNGPNKRPDD